jgi:hypothetical protein
MSPSSSAAPAFLVALGLFGCAAPAAQCPQPAAAPAAAPSDIRPVVSVSPDPGPANPSMMRGFPELPQPSPGAEVKQRVGLTDIRVTYSSPGAKGRAIWGALVPYGAIWRTGANAPTRVSFSREVQVGGTTVPAGSYSIFSIPGEAKWTVILNKDPDLKGSFEHDAAHDVAKLEVTPETSPPRERLTFLFEDTAEDGTKLVLDWAGKRIVLPIQVETQKHAEASIAATLENAWRPLFNAGRYAFEHGKDNKRALELLMQSIAIRPTWWNHWWVAQVHASDKNYVEARKHAQQALGMGEKDDVFNRAFAEDVKKALSSWPAG